jgi:vWA-MoxR associated protein C-terminal domain
MPDTHVWIVAVESYTAPDQDLSSPLDVQTPIAGAALELATLIKRRDPTALMMLNVSHRARPEYLAPLADLEAQGVVVAGCTQRELVASLRALRGGNTLIVYWVGHGVMYGDKRSVLTSESVSPSDLWALDINTLLKHLRSSSYAPIQLGFIDCCAQMVTTKPTLLALNGEGKKARRQYFYFSSSATEVAPANTRGPGFTRAVIDCLRDQVGPYDPTVLHRPLMARLDALKGGTKPNSLQWTAGSGDLWSHAGVEPNDQIETEARRCHLSRGEFEHLILALRGTESCPPERLSRALLAKNGVGDLVVEFQREFPGAAWVDLFIDAFSRLALARRIAPVAESLGLFWKDWLSLHAQLASFELHPSAEGSGHRSLVELLLATLDCAEPARGHDACIRLLELASRAIEALRPEVAERLRAFLLADATLGPRLPDAIAGLPSSKGETYLLVALTSAGEPHIPSIEAAWLYGDGPPDTLAIDNGIGTLAEQLNDLIQRARFRFPHRPLVVELLAPSELICMPKQWLELEISELGVTVWLEEMHSVALRWKTRMRGNKLLQPATWIQRAAEHRARRRRDVAVICTFADDGNVGDVVALTAPGPAPNRPLSEFSAFFDALLRGHPYMCWPRSQPEHLAAYRQAICQLVSANALPALAEGLRVAKEKHHPQLTDLMLLIDDPERNPYEMRLMDPF